MRRHRSGRLASSSAFLALSVAVLLGSLSNPSADAAIIGNATLVRNPPTTPFVGPDAALGAPWQGYTLGIQATAGEIIAAVDVSITGYLHQRWNFDEDSGLYAPTLISANQSNGDSHLRAPVSAIFGSGPTEDNSLTGSPLTNTAIAHYGVGTMLSGAWGIPLASQGSTANLAYIVVPSNRTFELSIRVKVANPLGDIIADLDTSDFIRFVDGPVVSVSGNGVLIPDGDTTPSPADGTDFGTVLAGSSQQRMFSIDVSGVGPLSLQQPVFTGPYSLVGSFPSSLDGGSTQFTVALDTNAGLGEHPGSISFGHDALGNSSPYNFALTARIVPEPASMALAFVVAIGCCGFIRRRIG